MSQELLKITKTDIIDDFGVIQIKLSNRGRRNNELSHIFDKNIHFPKNKNTKLLSKSLKKASRVANRKINDIECYSEYKDPEIQRNILIEYCRTNSINLLLHTGDGNSRGSYTTRVFIFSV